jgi:hypothetical protein
MEQRGIVVSGLSFLVAMLSILAAGCTQETFIYTRTIPKDASPVYKWHGSRTDIISYWGDRSISVEAAAYFPETWQHPGDGFWDVDGQTDTSTRIPMLGVIRRWVNQDGTRLTKIVPTVEYDKVNDGLYFVIDPNVTTRDGEITAIQPVAYALEIRDHRDKPFRPRILLIPEKESPLTPMPELPPEEPEGTPISID